MGGLGVMRDSNRVAELEGRQSLKSPVCLSLGASAEDDLWIVLFCAEN